VYAWHLFSVSNSNQYKDVNPDVEATLYNTWLMKSKKAQTIKSLLKDEYLLDERLSGVIILPDKSPYKLQKAVRAFSTLP
jgi:hypothetical protein